MTVIGRDESERPPLVVVGNGVEYMRIEPPPSETDEARGIEVVPFTTHRGAVDALLAAPMPEVESTLKGEEWAERYGEWWHEHVRPHVIGGQ